MHSELKEQDLIDRIAKLSHDIHAHHNEYGGKKDIISAYKVLGKGLVHSLHSNMDDSRISGRGKDTGNKHVDRFNTWFKAIGDKFKPLNKNLSPVKHAATEGAVKVIEANTMSPEEQAKAMADVFQEEAPQTMKALKGKRGKPTQPVPVAESKYYSPYSRYPSYNEMYQPQVYQPSTSYHYGSYMDEPQNEDTITYAKPYEPQYAKPYYDQSSRLSDSYGSSWQSKYGNGLSGRGGIGHKLVKGSANATLGLINSGSNRAIEEMGGASTGPETGMGIRGCGHKGGIGKKLVRGSANATLGLINSASNRAIREMDGSASGPVTGMGIYEDPRRRPTLKSTLNGRSLAQVRRGVPTTVIGRGGIGHKLVKGSANATLGLINSGSNRAIEEMGGASTGPETGMGISGRGHKGGIGKKLVRGSANATLGLINSASNRAIREMDGSASGPVTGMGVKCKKGRFVKGSPEAKAWGEKMRQSRSK